MIDIPLLVDYVRLVFSLVFMSILSIQDLKSREISSILVYLYLCVSVFVFMISTIHSDLPTGVKLFYSLVSIATSTGVFLFLYFYGLVGDGDVYVSSAIGLCFAYPDAYKTTLTRQGVFPPSLVILLYSTIASTLLMLINLIVNLSKHREDIEKIPAHHRILLPLVARPIKIEDYLAGRYKHVYPIQVFEVDENGSVRTYFKLLVDLDKEHRDDVENLVAKGLLSRDQYLWVTYGLPMVLFIYMGLVMFLALGDKPLLYLLSSIIRAPLR